MGLFRRISGQETRQYGKPVDEVEGFFSNFYRRQIGSAPSIESCESIRQAFGVISLSNGHINYTCASKQLEAILGSYGLSVGWDESKMEVGLGVLLTLCSKSRGSGAARGYEWAYNILARSMEQHCPRLAMAV